MNIKPLVWKQVLGENLQITNTILGTYVIRSSDVVTWQGPGPAALTNGVDASSVETAKSAVWEDYCARVYSAFHAISPVIETLVNLGYQELYWVEGNVGDIPKGYYDIRGEKVYYKDSQGNLHCTQLNNVSDSLSNLTDRELILEVMKRLHYTECFTDEDEESVPPDKQYRFAEGDGPYIEIGIDGYIVQLYEYDDYTSVRSILISFNDDGSFR